MDFGLSSSITVIRNTVTWVRKNTSKSVLRTAKEANQPEPPEHPPVEQDWSWDTPGRGASHREGGAAVGKTCFREGVRPRHSLLSPSFPVWTCLETSCFMRKKFYSQFLKTPGWAKLNKSPSFQLTCRF